MTDTLYYETYEKLVYVIENRRTLDEELFLRIFEGKIKPIIFNSFSKLSVHFNAEDAEDVCQDVFLLLWKKSVVGYFLNDKYEKSPIWFLSWCKIVINNYLITKVRKKANHPTEELDDPDKPIIIASASPDPGARLADMEAVREVYSLAVAVRAKIPMKLSWLGVYTLIYLGYVENKIEASHKFLESFLEKTLSEIYAFIASSLEKTEWLALSDLEKDILLSGLERDSDGRPYKERCLSEFLEKGRELSKLSDWLYKINKRIADALPQEVASGTFDR